MSLKRTAYDADALAEALLDSVKQHCRVDFTDDDSYLTQATGRAIGLIERTTSFAIAPAAWLWTPPALSGGLDVGGTRTTLEASNRCCACSLAGWQGRQGMQLPVCPVSAFKAMQTPPGGGAAVDVSASFELAGVSDPSQFQLQWLVIAAGATLEPGAIAVTLTAGYADAEALEPGVLDIVLRMTAYLYENREFASLPGFDVADYAASISAGLWIPSC